MLSSPLNFNIKLYVLLAIMILCFYAEIFLHVIIQGKEKSVCPPTRFR